MEKIFGRLAVFATVVALVACGGGGGGGTTAVVPTPTPVDTTKPVLTFTQLTSPVPLNQVFTLNSNEALASAIVRIMDNQPNSALAEEGDTTPSADGLKATWKPRVALTCGRTYTAIGNGWDAANNVAKEVTMTVTTEACVYHYAAFNVAIRNDQSNTLWAVDDNGVEVKLTNSTGFNPGGAIVQPLTNCALWDTVLPDNRPLASCLTPGAGNARRNFPVNPTTKELLAEWTGAVPTGAVLHSVFFGTFGDTPYAAQDVGNKGMYADVAANTVLFFTNSDDKLRRTADGFATNTVVNAGSHILIVRYAAK